VSAAAKNAPPVAAAIRSSVCEFGGTRMIRRSPPVSVSSMTPPGVPMRTEYTGTFCFFAVCAASAGSTRPPSLAPSDMSTTALGGSGSSGCQIAEELNQSGRTVYLSVGSCPWAPRRYRGRDFLRWAIDLGLMDEICDNLARRTDG